MGNSSGKNSDDLDRLASPRIDADDDELEIRSKLKAMRKSELKLNKKFETQITIMNDFKTSREKGVAYTKKKAAASEKLSLATELYLRSLREKQIPLNMFEVSVDSPRGRKRYEYDHAKLEKRDFVNFILADVQEPEEDAEKIEGTGTNAVHGASDNKMYHPVSSPIHRDSFANVLRGSEADHRRSRHGMTPNHFSGEEDSPQDDEFGDEFENEAGMQESDVYGNENFTQKLEEHNNLELMQNRQIGDGTPGGTYSPHPKKEVGFAARVQNLHKRRDTGNKDAPSPDTPVRKSGHAKNTPISEEEPDSGQPPEIKERQKQISAMEMNLDPETRARLRIIQAIHGDKLDKSLYMQAIKEKKKIIIESDDENEENEGDDERHPDIGGENMASAVIANPNNGGGNSPRGGNKPKGKDRAKDPSESGQNSNLATPQNVKMPSRVSDQMKSNKTPERKDPIIKLAEDNDEEEERRYGGKTSKSNLSPPKKGNRPGGASSKNAGSLRFGNM